MRTEPVIPADPCGRLIEIAEAVSARKRWFQGWASLRFASVGLLVAPGTPDEVADRLFARAEGLKSALPWWSSLRSDIRFCLAAMLVTRGLEAGEFVEALEIARGHFRASKLPRSEAHEGLACVVLMDRAAEGLPSAAQVEQLRAIYDGMKREHPFLTRRDDLAAAALLCAAGESVERVVERLEQLYGSLRDLRFSRGNQLQLATHLLYFAPDPDDVLARRFRALYDGFKARGLWMHTGDYDEVAILASLGADPGRVVEHTLADRERLRAALDPRPSSQTGFELASATAFLGLVPESMEGDDATITGWQLAQVIALVQAQQAAMVGAVAAGTAAAGAAG